MLAHLVPCSGGKPIALLKPNLYLGRRESVAVGAPLSPQTARCRLRLVNGWWEIDRLDPATELKINNRRCENGRARPGDELAIGRARYRLEYESPDCESEFAMQVLATVPPAERAAIGELKASSGEIPIVRESDARPPRTHGAPAAATISRPPCAPPRGVHARLVPIGGGADYSIFKPAVTVGRDSSCDISLRVKTISSVHCRLELIEGYWRVIDLGSRNGVRVDGARCQEAWVFPESRLAISDQRFQLEYQPTGERPMLGFNDPVHQRSLMDKIGLKEAQLDAILPRIDEQYGKDETQNRRRDLRIDS